MKIGFHIPFSGNLKRLSNRVITTRGNVFQFYSRSIRGGKIPEINKTQLHNYYNFLYERKISSVIMLCPLVFKVNGLDYSTNLAVHNPIAVDEVLKDLEYAHMIQARYYVINAGYAKGQSEFQAIEILKNQLSQIIEKTKWTGTILVRNMSGGGTEIAADLYMWNEIISVNPRVMGAMDFSRAFAYGYSFIQKDDADALLYFIEREVGWDKIPLIYINDSNRFAGSKNNDVVPLGEGVIGFHGYSNILNNLKNKIWIVENQPELKHYDASIDFLVKFFKK